MLLTKNKAVPYQPHPCFPMRTSFFACLFFLSPALEAQSERFLIELRDAFLDSVDLHAHSGFFSDPGGRLNAEEVFRQKDILFHEPPAAFRIDQPERAKYWFHFQIHNLTADSLHRFLQMRLLPADKIRLFRFRQGKLTGTWETGRLVPWQRLPFLKDHSAMPLTLAAGEEGEFLYSLEFSHPNATWSGRLTLLTPKAEAAYIKQFYEEHGPYLLYFFCFLGVIAFLFCLTLLQFCFFREPALPIYAAYLASIFLYYLHDLEWVNLSFHFFFKYISQWHHYFKATFQVLPMVAYLAFVSRFLDLSTVSPAHSRWAKRGGRAFLAVIPILFFVTWYWGATTCHTLFSGMVIGMLPFGAYFIVTAFRRARSGLAMFIVAGTSFLLLASLMTHCQDVFGGYNLKSPPGIVGWYYHPSGWQFPVFDFKAVIILEMLCFSVGLTWKIRQQRIVVKNELEAEQAVRQRLQRRLLDVGTGNRQSNLPVEPSDDFLTRVSETLEKQGLGEDFDIPAFAKAMNMSRVQLYRKLHTLTGKSPTDFIRHYRLQAARRLLETSTLTVSEVAYRTGFSNPTHFSRVFKKEFGISPKEVANGK